MPCIHKCMMYLQFCNCKNEVLIKNFCKGLALLCKKNLTFPCFFPSPPLNNFHFPSIFQVFFAGLHFFLYFLMIFKRYAFFMRTGESNLKNYKSNVCICFFTLPYFILTFLYRYSTCNCKISDFYQTLKKTFFPDFSVTVAPC